MTSAVIDGTTSVVDSRVGGVCGVVSVLAGSTECRRESSLLFLLLVLGTVWLGLSLYNFTKTLVRRYILASKYWQHFELCNFPAGSISLLVINAVH